MESSSVVHPLTMIETDTMGFVEGNPSIGQYGSFEHVSPGPAGPSPSLDRPESQRLPLVRLKPDVHGRSFADGGARP